MIEEEVKLRTKFYLAPKDLPLETLRQMDKEYTSYPGLNLKQAQVTAGKLKSF